ncbi:hypothetical protein CDA63_18690 [Hymenobacter amundsenii]|uniref:Putative auto-transporter adhesin head GIN domain-containing protein n=1 Tax=Hymenobacter amundsenii TaxID=2006685 RepID=A0A246FGC2_9BACT|nr:DUF2807 domain-containing protein [Hymenobacter amundsenii]OWP61572.1 hypothetical protein CDA63_18690 [Hymenobacter amundsenii]
MKSLTLLAFCLRIVNPGQGQVTTTSDFDSRSLGNYSSVEVTDGIELHVLQGPTRDARVQASTLDYRNKIKTVVQNNVLKVYFDYSGDRNWKGLVNSKERFKVYISLPSVNALTALNGASVVLDNAFQAKDDIYVNLAAGGTFTGKVEVPSATFRLRSGAQASMSGSATKFDVHAIEGSKFNGSDLLTQTCAAFSSSSSDISIDVHKTLEARAVNKACIRFKGSASSISKKLRAARF